MNDVFLWWLVVEVIGLITFPIAFVFLGRLPDRGYSFNKALGLALMAFFLFIGAAARVITNSRGGLLVILALMALAAAFIAFRQRQELARFLRQNWSYLLFVEALFAVAFVTAAWLRSYVPDLAGTEKPSEFAFLNAVLNSQHFPAYDPWLSPEPLSYYYFGFIMAGGLIKLTSVPPEVGFNIAVALIGGLTTVVAFGVVYNLVAAVASAGRALAFGLVGVGLVVVLSNLEGVFEMLAAHGLGPSALYAWVGIDGLNLEQVPRSSEWYPDGFFFFWRSTRIPSNWDIREYPFFSLLLGDLHPHFMVMPFSLLSVGIAFNLLRREEVIDHLWALRHWLPFLIAAIVIGGVSFFNAWSYPPTVALLLLAVLARNYWQRQQLWPAVIDTAGFALPFIVLSLALYAPFYWSARGSLWGLAPVEAVARPDYLPLLHMITHPKHLLFAWGPFLWLALGLGLAGLSWTWLRQAGGRAWLALLPGLLPLALWALLALADLGPDRFGDELNARNENVWTLLFLIGLIAVVTLAFARAMNRDEEGADSNLIALGAMGVSLLLIYGTELFYVLDHLDGSRENTVFKFHHHAWLFMGVAGAFGLHYVLRDVRWQMPRPIALPRWACLSGRQAWLGVASLLLAAALVLPVAATFNRTNGFTGSRTLDGLAFLRRINPHEYEAVRWLRENIEGTPVILEALGEPFEEGGRISSRTGLPTILQWPNHEKGYRGPGSDAMLQERRNDVETAYRSLRLEEALPVLRKYEVRYVVVGQVERQEYGEGADKFAQALKPVYQNDSVTIYRVPDAIALVREP